MTKTLIIRIILFTVVFFSGLFIGIAIRSDLITPEAAELLVFSILCFFIGYIMGK